jgi:hypothetical protein
MSTLQADSDDSPQILLAEGLARYLAAACRANPVEKMSITA